MKNKETLSEYSALDIINMLLSVCKATFPLFEEWVEYEEAERFKNMLENEVKELAFEKYPEVMPSPSSFAVDLNEHNRKAFLEGYLLGRSVKPSTERGKGFVVKNTYPE